MKLKKDKIYPDSEVELTPFTAINYDKIMNIATLGLYRGFIHRAIKAMNIQSEDKILDLGCGTGRNACIMGKYLSGTGKITGMDISPIMERQFNKKLKNYVFLINTQGVSLVLMPFLILYAKKNLSAGSQEIGNFLLLKVIGGVLAGSILFYYSKKVKYQYMLYVTSIITILIPLSILILPGSILFPYIFLAGGIVFAIHIISTEGVLLEVTNNENRALYTGLSGAGNILPVVFPLLSGWIITEFGFRLFFILVMLIIFLSFYFIYKLDCKK